MKTNQLYEQIKDEFYINNDYEKTIKLIEEYLNNEDYCIFDNLLDMYIKCQMNLGYLKEATRNIELMQRIFPDYYDKLSLALKYSLCNEFDKLATILKVTNFSADEYYQIARNCYYNCNYVKAKELFLNCISNTDNQELITKAEEFIDKINIYKYKNKNVFNEEYYLNFKIRNEKLKPGHIIYVSKIRDELFENSTFNDPKKNVRPYMIWKIENDDIYAFPISTQTNGKSYVLPKENYLIHPDRIVKNNLVHIKENDVVIVTDKISDNDYNEAINNIYVSICLASNMSKEKNKKFMDSIVEDFHIEENDIITKLDYDTKHLKYYFIIDIDKKNKYKVVELKKTKDKFIVKENKLTTLSNKVAILRVTKLSETEKNEILDQIPTNYKNTNMLGEIISYNSKKLQIMQEREDYYICIDRTFGDINEYIFIELIPKDIPMHVIDTVSNEEYEKNLYVLGKYLSANIKDLYSKRRAFLKKYKRK